ncbi:MAG: NTP transferase domain-containing protein [Dehalococcoidia bacterium]
MKTVILAAGDGGRLGPHTAQLPKPLVALNGRPILSYTLEALAAAGVEDVVVVTGYREPQLIEALGRALPRRFKLATVTNPRFQGGASLSLRAARDLCGSEPFLLLMADHLLSAPLVTRLLLESRHGAIRGISSLAVDASTHDPAYTAEATKVQLNDAGFVTAIGKALQPWSALDTGAFVLSPAAWEAVDLAPEDCELSVIFAILARKRALRAVDVSGAFWYDVDTAEDLAAAATLLSGGHAPAPQPAGPRVPPAPPLRSPVRRYADMNA